MTRLRRGLGTWLMVTAVATGIPASVQAQNRRTIEVAAGYQGVPDASLDESGMVRDASARGWTVDVAFPWTRVIALVGAVDGSSGHQTRRAGGIFSSGTVDSSWTDTSYLAGIRWQAARERRISPFVQVLSGVVRARKTLAYHTVPAIGTFSGTDSLWITDVGGGVNLMLTRRLGVRIGGDLRIDPIAAAYGADSTMGRVYGGVVFRIP